VWALGPLFLLVLGLIDLRRRTSFRWWFTVGWLITVAASMAVGLVVLHDFGLLFSAYPLDLDGTPLTPSRFAPGGPYWPALLAAVGQLAVCAIMIALVAALSRSHAKRIDRESSAANTAADERPSPHHHRPAPCRHVIGRRRERLRPGLT
jgi:hypothetical protein